MKLYTEEQVREAYNEGCWNGFNEIKDAEDYTINLLIPIELPSYEEIKEGLLHRSNEYAIGFKDAIEYIKQQYK